MRIAVAGASGLVGSGVVELLRTRGHEVVPITRAAGVDVYTGIGLLEALTGVEVVIDALNAPENPDTDAAVDFFTRTATNLQRAAETAGVRRIVLTSIIGIDPFVSGHNAGKLAQERTLRAGPVPVHIVRAAQFHEFPRMMLEWTTQADTAYIPPMRTQLVALPAVVDKLVEIAVDPLAPELVNIAGPQELRLVDAAAELAARRGYPARVEEIPVTDATTKLQDAGALLPGPDAVLTGETFGAWLDRNYPVH
ncbi:epimerase [Nocardia panacis]|uniref:Epimerase n=1 Tax=Nocardia panacis TaxID=2340916 RepID=A0A3A4KZ89_9NOCA|nr:NAD(P)H-binding protein [Nocardia panacis]RJO79274.1 epimerase [Nocardia panacis]